MATRTAVLFSPMVGFSFFLRCCCRLLGGDQLVEPAHFTLTGFETELVELLGVAIQRAARFSDRVAKRLTALLDLASSAFENPHPRLCGSAAEEGEMNAESVIGVVLRTRVGDQFLEPLLTDRRELVD